MHYPENALPMHNFPDSILGIVMVSNSLSDENIKILEIYLQKHLIKSKIIEKWKFSSKFHQTSL